MEYPFDQSIKKYPQIDQQTPETFSFGLESEFLLVKDDQALWHEELDFDQLNRVLEGIAIEDLEGDFSTMEVETPHTKLMPFLVEGYHRPSSNDVAPKGLEIRTPVFTNLTSCLDNYSLIHKRLSQALKEIGLQPVSLSHHPLHSSFYGEKNKRRVDFWHWAMSAMTTYGPDINIAPPKSLLENFDLKDFHRKVNYYAPALAALSVGSPFKDGGPWMIKGQWGESFRTYKRSVNAPAIEYHGDEKNRLEFKFFEMTPYREDLEGQFLLCALLICSPQLKGRSDQADRIYDLGLAARMGLENQELHQRLEEVFSCSEDLTPYGLNPKGLSKLKERWQKRYTLSAELKELWRGEASFQKIYQFLTPFYQDSSQAHSVKGAQGARDHSTLSGDRPV